ncbi:MAG: glycosyltransferase family 1 protein [Campylobacterales bacterium]|nr:glycosyltransferase family 1 protein [Campylobacterales bacterium]
MDTTSKAPKHRIVLVSDTVFDANGVSRFIHDLAATAQMRGDPFYVLTSSPLSEARSEGNIINVRPLLKMRMPFYKTQFLILTPPFVSFYRHLRRLRPDIVHISTPGPLGWSALLLSRLMGIHTTATYHTDFPAYLRENLRWDFAARITAWVMRSFYRRMVLVFARSKGFEGVLVAQVGVRSECIVTLQAGIDTERFAPHYRRDALWEELGIRLDSLKILYVGRLSVEKRFDLLYDLASRVLLTCKRKVDFIFVGEGEVPEDHLQQMHFLGRQGGVTLSELYASSDLFVFASTTETLGQAVMEAQASGLCALVSDEGGVREIVCEGESGFLIPVHRPQEWIERLLEVIENDGLRQAMGHCAAMMMRERTFEKSYDDFMRSHEALYM